MTQQECEDPPHDAEGRSDERQEEAAFGDWRVSSRTWWLWCVWCVCRRRTTKKFALLC